MSYNKVEQITAPVDTSLFPGKEVKVGTPVKVDMTPVPSFIGSLTPTIDMPKKGILIEVSNPTTQTSDGTLRRFEITNTSGGSESIAVTQSGHGGDDTGETDDPGTD